MKYFKILVFLAVFWVPTEAHGAAFYADLSAACGGTGTATTTPFCSLDEFADVARSAGDILFVRRGSATTTGISDLTFTSDGTLNNPIVMTADYDNLWQDFSTSSVTATVTQGSTTMPTSASTTDITVGDWVYIAGDCYERPGLLALSINPCEYAYEVASATPTYLEFYFPYKGFNNGAGKAIRRMPPNPQWSTSTQDFQWVSSADNHWLFKGFSIYSTDSFCALNLGTNVNPSPTVSIDMILVGDGSSACAIVNTQGGSVFKKIRTFNTTGNAISSQTNTTVNGVYLDMFVDCNNNSSSRVFAGGSAPGGSKTAQNIIVRRCTDFALGLNSATTLYEMIGSFRNITGVVSFSSVTGGENAQMFFEDFGGTPNLSKFVLGSIAADGSGTTTVSTSTSLRSGGGIKNQYVYPPSGSGNTGVSTLNFPHSYIKLFEYPLYSDGSSKTYTMYFLSASTSAFTVSPFTTTQSGSSTPELFIECEYYADPVDADRVTKRSNTANDVDFTSADWQDISVTCDPSQAGILYLRGYYGKPREASTNNFYMDLTPVIN